MTYGYPIVGLTVQVRNLTDNNIKDLVYEYGNKDNHIKISIDTIQAMQIEKFIVVNSHLKETSDLIFHFESNGESFVFHKVVHPYTTKQLFPCFFVKIVENNHQLIIEEDEDGEYFYKLNG